MNENTFNETAQEYTSHNNAAVLIKRLLSMAHCAAKKNSKFFYDAENLRSNIACFVFGSAAKYNQNSFDVANKMDGLRFSIDAIPDEYRSYLKEAIEILRDENHEYKYVTYLPVANFSNVDFEGVTLSHFVLAGSNFEGANLRNIDAEGTDFTDATLKDADLRGANLSKIVHEIKDPNPHADTDTDADTSITVEEYKTIQAIAEKGAGSDFDDWTDLADADDAENDDLTGRTRILSSKEIDELLYGKQEESTEPVLLQGITPEQLESAIIDQWTKVPEYLQETKLKILKERNLLGPNYDDPEHPAP